MSKIQELKAKLTEKVAALKSKLFKAKGGTAPAAATPAPATASSEGMFTKIGKAWREGSTGTRMLLIVMLFTTTVCVYAVTRLGLRMVERRHAFQNLFHRGTERYDKMEDFLKKQTEMRQDTLSVVSIDKVRINAILDNGKPGFLAISIWVKCDSPRTARYVEEIYPKLHDAIIAKVQTVKEGEITSDEGKDRLKATMLNAMNSVMGTGKITEVHFFNVIFE